MRSGSSIWIGILIGSTIGGLLPGLWGDSMFSYTSVLLSGVRTNSGLCDHRQFDRTVHSNEQRWRSFPAAGSRMPSGKPAPTKRPGKEDADQGDGASRSIVA